MTIDYRDLLAKYIDHVGEEEGTTFLVYPRDRFTTEELAALREIEAEVAAKRFNQKD